MQHTPAQREQFDRDGYLFFPSLFTPEEIQTLIAEVPRLSAQLRPKNVREKGSDAVCTNFAVQMHSYLFANLARVGWPAERYAAHRSTRGSHRAQRTSATTGRPWWRIPRSRSSSRPRGILWERSIMRLPRVRMVSTS
ncbi:MAG: hypothetical protein ACRERE_41605 [Candidatus Entotheonellia bacterium]